VEQKIDNKTVEVYYIVERVILKANSLQRIFSSNFTQAF